jgi:hypothetical protein
MEIKMREELLQILQHSLGLDEYGQGDMYRNHFCAGGEDVFLCRELVNMGYMIERNPSELTGGSIPFFVSENGKSAVLELSKKPPKISKAKRRYQLYRQSESDQTFSEWLKDAYWNDYRKENGC